MEAIAIYTLSMHEQKALFYKATQLSSSNTSSSSTSSSSSKPSSTNAPPPPLPPNRPPPPPPPPLQASSNNERDQPSPASSSSNSISAASPSSNSTPLPPGLPRPPPPPPPPAPAPASNSNNSNPNQPPPPSSSTASSSSTTTTSTTNKPLPPQTTTKSATSEDFLKQFLKASPELFRFQKLYDESCSLLSNYTNSQRIIPCDNNRTTELVLPNPTTSSTEEEGELSIEGTGGGSIGVMIILPIELARGTGSPISSLMIPSQVGYCRRVLKDWIVDQLGLDYEFVKIGV